MTENQRKDLLVDLKEVFDSQRESLASYNEALLNQEAIIVMLVNRIYILERYVSRLRQIIFRADVNEQQRILIDALLKEATRVMVNCTKGAKIQMVQSIEKKEVDYDLE